MISLSRALDISVALTTPDTFKSAVSEREIDMVILDVAGVSNDFINRIDSFVVEKGLIPILFVVDEDKIPDLRIPVQGSCDFIVPDASEAEYSLRISQLAWPSEESAASDLVSIDNMTINLATYQVTIDDKPVDLTLMEYSLLSFLATHPSRAYSREVLLHRVWGFEYCGGTRTVDVHIRRVRSKVGPQVASHITTVRGVGYLFKL